MECLRDVSLTVSPWYFIAALCLGQLVGFGGSLTLQHSLNKNLDIISRNATVHPSHGSVLILIAVQVLRGKLIDLASIRRLFLDVEGVALVFRPHNVQIIGSLDKTKVCKLRRFRHTIHGSAGLSLPTIEFVEFPFSFLAFCATEPYALDLSFSRTWRLVAAVA